ENEDGGYNPAEVHISKLQNPPFTRKANVATLRCLHVSAPSLPNYLFNSSTTGWPIFPLGSSIWSNAATVGAMSVMCVSRLVLPCLIPQPIITNGMCAS